MMNPKRAINFQRAKEKRDNTQAIGMDIAKKMNCRKTMAKDDPLVSSEWIDEAEKTIIKPRMLNPKVLPKSM
jgi:hypothetical protein